MLELTDEERKSREDAIDLQEARWRTGTKDGVLLEKARRVIKDFDGHSFVMETLFLEHTLFLGYLHTAATQAGYASHKSQGVGQYKSTIYEIPEIPIGKCKAVLKKFGEIE